ncbi:MAG: ParB/RepB/Spo0J family partition protein [Candidatus Cloacimonetes bacterium]|nr:ParB/RepB/Spo0J family partition protein [Candidatus Cloacimonadota bacterium]
MTRLGKGLEALINSGPESTDKTTGITTIKIDHIKPNRFQPRKIFNEKKLQELANSLKENGIIQPIIVTKRDDSQYELVAGERRLEASRLAGYDEIPVIIRSVSPKEQLLFSIIENVQREDLTAIEEAKAYQQLNEDFELTHAQISEIVGKDRVTITNLIRLLKLSENIQQLILNDKLSPGHARAILQVDEDLQEEFASLILRNILSVRKAELEAKRIKETGAVSKQKTTSPVIPEFKDYEKKLKKLYKTKIKISGKNDKGRISFYYNSEEGLGNLLNLLEKKR